MSDTQPLAREVIALPFKQTHALRCDSARLAGSLGINVDVRAAEEFVELA